MKIGMIRSVVVLSKEFSMKISKENAARLESNCVSSQPNGKTFTLTVNGAILTTLNTKNAVAIDYLLFLDGITKALLQDRGSLEKEANYSGRTIGSHGLSSIGSVGIPEVADK
jgi:hypothetical protein